jgi:glycosyltransferase involved in cell wall biosynthesis
MAMNESVREAVLSIIMPVYSEAVTVATALQRVQAVPIAKQVVVVDDGSTDGTRLILERLQAEGRIDVLIMHEVNRGKGAAVRTGIEHATGDIVVVQDADMEYDPFDLPRLMEPILDGRADAVFGSRFLGGPARVLYFWHRVGNGLLTLLSNMLTNINLSDMETCYKMVRADLIKTLPLRTDRFGIEPELTARLAQARARIFELPISYNGRTYEEGKKIGWKDGVAAIWHILRANLSRAHKPSATSLLPLRVASAVPVPEMHTHKLEAVHPDPPKRLHSS